MDIVSEGVKAATAALMGDRPSARRYILTRGSYRAGRDYWHAKGRRWTPYRQDAYRYPSKAAAERAARRLGKRYSGILVQAEAA